MGTLGGNIAQLNRCWYFRNQKTVLTVSAKVAILMPLQVKNHQASIFGGRNRYQTVYTGTAATDIPAIWINCDEIMKQPTHMQVNPMPITGRVCAHFANQAVTVLLKTRASIGCC